MTTETEVKKEEKVKPIWSAEEKENSKVIYGTEIVVENGSYEEVSITKAPTDCYIVKYLHEDKVHFDLTRGTKVTIFDMYWDKFQAGLKSIDYGKGTVKPNLWGYQQAPPNKKKRKG